MTGLIFNGLQQQRFSLPGFYASRARRIIPALLTLCVALLMFGYVYLPLEDFRETIRTLKSSLLFSSNFTFAKDGNYFDAPLHENWLLHTWSLSVEWQFYLLYPVLIMGFYKFLGAQKTRAALIALALLSFAASVVLSKTHPVFAFYMLPTRAWEMLAGGLVFLYPLRLGSRNGSICEGLGLLAIFISVLCFSQDDLWPGYLALLPVLGTMLVIYGNTQSVFSRNQTMQFVGSISYSVPVALAAGGALVSVRSVEQLASCARRDRAFVGARGPNGNCMGSRDGVPLYFDDNHLVDAGNQQLKGLFKGLIKPI
ncbi:acyltransferase [Pseudomonas fluorescens]|uniref:acyltransferase family protein n=1 Tax=Pseudomonas fluorescens TaxID=294 RepID=UPI00223ACDCB|nr:acyltransferase family protein [Pseudomonas fluorescens]